MFRNIVEWTRELHVHHVDNEEHYHSLVVLHGLHYRECIGGATLIGLNWWGCMELHSAGCIIGGAIKMRWGCIGLQYKGYTLVGIH